MGVTAKRSLPPELVRNQEVRLPGRPPVRFAATTQAEYIDLHRRETAMRFDKALAADDYLHTVFGFPARPEHFAVRAVGELEDVPLAIGTPDLHRGNYGQRPDGSLLLFDPEGIGYHPPMYALAVADVFGEYTDDDSAAFVTEHKAAAPPDCCPSSTVTSTHGSSSRPSNGRSESQAQPSNRQPGRTAQATTKPLKHGRAGCTASSTPQDACGADASYRPAS
ncbi:hypothetical protein ACU686_12600 [Yinghuangia aomiensis]